MKLARLGITTLLAFTGTGSLFAASLPATDDTFSYNTKITVNQGKLATAPVDARHRAFVLFDLSSVPALLPADIRYARLRVYLPSVRSAGGGLDIHQVTGPWDEAVAAPEPPFNPVAVATIPAGALGKRRFASVDVTAAVQAWIATPASNLGFAILPNGGASAVLSTKEGTGSGYPAELEIELADLPIPPGSIDSSLLAPNLTLGGTTMGTFSGDGMSLTNLSVMNLVGQIGNTQIADGSVSAIKLGADVGLWSVNGGDVFRPGGNVGIGINAPTSPFHVVETSAASTTTTALLTSAGIGSGLTVQLNNASNGARAVDVSNSGVGPGVFSNAAGGSGLWGITGSISAAGVLGDNTRGGESVVGRTTSNQMPEQNGSGVGAVVGRNDLPNGYGVRGFVTDPVGGIGVLGQAGISAGTGVGGRFENVNAANGNDALQAATNGTGWAANLTNANNSSASRGVRISTTAGQGGNALTVANGTTAFSYQHPYASNTVVDDTTLVVTTAGNVTVPTGPPLVDGAHVYVVNNAGAVITITNTTVGAFNVNPGRAVQLLFVSTVSGANWIPVQP